MKPFCFSLSGIYESEGYAWEQAGKIWDLRELRGTDGYLDPETEQFLEAELGRKKETKELPRIRLLDSGNYHYMSKLLLGLEKEDLFLAVFDHHTDMQPPALLPVLSCGSWIRDAARAYQNIKGICVIGPPEASVRETEAMEHVWFVTQEELDDGSGAAKIKEVFASHAGTFPVYLSVDKDILSKEELDTNWDQGNVRVDELLSLAKDCLAGRKVLAVAGGGVQRGKSGKPEAVRHACGKNRRLTKPGQKSIINSYPDGVYRVTEHKEETSWVNVVHTAVNATGKKCGMKKNTKI
jgi:hypothetical protein